MQPSHRSERPQTSTNAQLLPSFPTSVIPAVNSDATAQYPKQWFDGFGGNVVDGKMYVSGPPFEIRSKEDAARFIVNCKLTRWATAQQKQTRFVGYNAGNDSRDQQQQQQQQWIKPSGPRRPGEGLDDCEQGIVTANTTANGVVMTCTQLLAGFLIGPNGSSIRDLMRRIGCQIKSFMKNVSFHKQIRARVFLIEGLEDQVLTCLDVLLAAVDRYKDLAEGRYEGVLVQRMQRIKGYVFYYYPPPKNVVPTAAAIKGSPPSKQAKVAQSLLGFQSTGSYLAYLDSICHQIGKPPAKQGLTDYIRQSLELPPEEIDDVGCTYPGLFPGRVYFDDSPQNWLMEDLDSQASGLARAVHLKESLEVSNNFRIEKNCIAGKVSDENLAQRLQFDSIPQEILNHAESLIACNPEVFQVSSETNFADMKREVVNQILTFLGYPGEQEQVPPNTGVYLGKQCAEYDPVVPNPSPRTVYDLGRIYDNTFPDNPVNMGMSLVLPKSPVKNKMGKELGVGNGSGNNRTEIVNNDSFRRTPFARFQGSRKPLSPLQLKSTDNGHKQHMPNYFDQGIILDVQKIIKQLEDA